MKMKRNIKAVEEFSRKIMGLLSLSSIKSIKSKFILIFILLVILPMSASTSIAYYKSSVALNSQASKYTLLVMKQLNKNINVFVDQMDKLSGLPLLDYNYMGNNVQRVLKNSNKTSENERIRNENILREFFLNIIFMNKYIDNVSIYANDGNIYSFYDEVGYDYNYQKQDWYKNTIQAGGKKYIIGTHNKEAGNSKSKQIFTLSKQIKDFSTRKPMGVITINADVAAIADICREIDLGKDSNVVIVSEDGNIIYNNNEKYILTEMNKGPLNDIFFGKSGEIIESIQDKDVLVTWYTSEYTGWKLIGIVPVKEINKDIIQIRESIVFIMSLFIILVFVFFISISSGIINPINKLRSLMKKAEKGDFNISIQINNNDEIKQLGERFNIMITKIKELIDKVYTIELAKKQAELNALQTQINPHYLYNTLESIRMMAALNDDIEVMNMIAVLGDTFRYSININNEVVAIEEEIKHVKNYLIIQKMRYQERLQVEIDIDESILYCKILKLVIQPIVENSIYHGLGNKIGVGNITLSGNKKNDQIRFEITDDGAGMTIEQLVEIKEVLKNNKHSNDKRSMGLSNINERLRLYFGDAYSIDIISSSDIGTKVVIIIPVEYIN